MRREPTAQQAAAQPSDSVHVFALPADLLEGRADRGAQALPPLLLRKMEAFFGHDFTDVRIHVDSQAASIGALAFTLGTDIYFAPGHYQPYTRYGQQLIGHELMHVVQQDQGRVPAPPGDGVAVVQDPALEDEAERMGYAVAAEPNLSQAPPQPPPALAAGYPAVPAARPNAGYQLIVGAYLHDEPYPEALAGHSFIAIQAPGGRRHAFGFSPVNFGHYDPHRDLQQLMIGVEGIVHDDDGAFAKPGVKTRVFAINEAQANAAMAKIHEYQSGRYRFSLALRQCTAFALDVLHAAQSDALGEPCVQPPREIYHKL